MPSVPSRWTQPSVLALAKGRDPVEAVTERAREIVTEAMDRGWSGPPFDPLALADILKIQVHAREDVRDARTVPSEEGVPRIEYNPTRPRARVRYSLAHEIAHTFFPDWADEVRHRAEQYELKGDDWQLEALCNIAAAELIMPMGSFMGLAAVQLGIDDLLSEQKRFDTSMEALLIRAVHLRPEQCAIFCASPVERGTHAGRYRIDYSIASRSWKIERTIRGLLLPQDTIVASCSAIGFTAKGRESWSTDMEVRVEAVGIPPYPGSASPRVVGLLLPLLAGVPTHPELIEFILGDATKPFGDGRKM
ncbi:MAG TPA: ImmA/IrrE family metallo-endopeptidase, partial [Nitrospiraceae bacterium]|nr:ImmA/IrrE family metallo-endopeptidase [Nitrospiraceae bacterium]